MSHSRLPRRSRLSVEQLEGRALPATGLSSAYLPAQDYPDEFDKLGAYRPSDGSFSLDNGDGAFDAQDTVFMDYAPPGAIPIVGNWDNSPDGRDELGYFDDGAWHLDMNGNGVEDAADAVFAFGGRGDTPVIGRWDGVNTRVGVFGTRGAFTGFILDVDGSHDLGGAEYHIFGVPGDQVLVGDWTGNGSTSIGVFRANPDGSGAALFSLDLDGNFYYDGYHEAFIYGMATDGFVVGDWNNDGIDNLGVYRNSPFNNGVGYFSLDYNGNRLFEAGIDQVFHYGLATDYYIAGNWYAQPFVVIPAAPDPYDYEYAPYGYDDNLYGDAYDPYGYDPYGYDPYGYDSYGYDPYGYDPYEYDSYEYDPAGVDPYGYDPYGYDPYEDEYDPYGYDR